MIFVILAKTIIPYLGLLKIENPMKTLLVLFAATLFLFGTIQCQKDDDPEPQEETHDPEPYDIEIPHGFPDMDIPEDNPMTHEGVELGRMLYYDPVLHPEKDRSCATCHQQEYGFTEPDSEVLPHINLGWSDHFLWDGREEAKTLEEINIFEIETFFGTDLEDLNEHPDYPELFEEAFGKGGDDDITVEMVAKAISQFMRTQISADSKFDKFRRGEAQLTPAEQRGYEIFFSEPRVVSGSHQPGGDCFHCHAGVTFTADDFFNTGLDSTYGEHNKGYFVVTGDSSDLGAFKAPTLRNAELREGYMHDNRFSTLREVVEFYNSGGHNTPFTDPFMKTAGRGGLQLHESEKEDLIAFLKTLTDESFIEDPDLSDPF